MTATEEAIADIDSETELTEVISAITTEVSDGTLRELKVTADEDVSPALIELSRGMATEDKVARLVGTLSSGSVEIWTVADIDMVLSTTLLDCSVGSGPRDCERVLGIETIRLDEESVVSAV